MPIHITYARARASLDKLCDLVANDHEIVVIHRRDSRDVALISAEELSGIMETTYLLDSPRNAKRLVQAMNRALAINRRH